MEIIVYTDGSCKGNPGKGGWAFMIMINEKVVVTQSDNDVFTTNNRMEMTAVIEALKYLEKRTDTSTQTNPIYPETTLIKMKVDSQYVIKGITTWIHGWKKNNWKNSKKEDVLNRDLWEALDASTVPFPNIEWVWVKGHADDKYNILVDNLACSAANRITSK
jgi:ribonuclease HI